jgi:hypothetical protein
VSYCIEQCFSTFLRLRNPKWTQNFGGTRIPLKKTFQESHSNFSKLTNSS